MPQYMFMLFDDESWYDHVDDAAFAEEMKLHQAFCEAVAAAGAQVVGGEALERSSTATVVRRNPERADSTPLLTDGPFIETKEALGGFYVIEARDLDQAVELAAQCPSTVIEVLPVMAIPDEFQTDDVSGA